MSLSQFLLPEFDAKMLSHQNQAKLKLWKSNIKLIKCLLHMIQNPIKRETRLPSVTGGGQVTQLILKNSSTIISVRHWETPSHWECWLWDISLSVCQLTRIHAPHKKKVRPMSAFPFCCVSQDCIIAICYLTKRSSTYRESSLPFSCRREKLLSARISDNFKYPDEYIQYTVWKTGR